MFSYVLKRLLFFIPTLIIISLASFGLSKMAPGDPVKLALGNKDTGGEAATSMEKQAGVEAYNAMAEKMGLNLPSFYFNITTSATPDTLYKFLKRQENEALSRLISQYGNWEQIQAYFHQIDNIENALIASTLDSLTFEAGKNIRDNCDKLHIESSELQILSFITDLKLNAQKGIALKNVYTEVEKLETLFQEVKAKATPQKNYFPALHWYGFNNQYHNWISKFVVLDFGFSYIDKRPVWSKLKEALPWTILINIISIFISYLVAVPLGVWSARVKDSVQDRIVTIFLFILNSLASFWVATMAVMFLTTDEYGMNFFPTFGLGDVSDDMSLFEIINVRAYHLILPVFAITYGSFAYLSRQMRGGVLTVLRQDYIRTARAKGLTEGKVIWKHAFRNSLIPLITIFAYLLPAAISGSFIVEYIFSIPGMGTISLQALFARDYPVVFTVLMLSAFLTLLGTLLSDILYAYVDPRISYK